MANRLGWDEVLPSEIAAEWNKFAAELPRLSQLRLPRHIGFPRLVRRILGFCDASEKGYAAVIYLHITYELSLIHI